MKEEDNGKHSLVLGDSEKKTWFGKRTHRAIFSTLTNGYLIATLSDKGMLISTQFNGLANPLEIEEDKEEEWKELTKEYEKKLEELYSKQQVKE